MPTTPSLPLPLVYAVAEFAVERASRLRTIAQLSRDGLAFARAMARTSQQRVWAMTTRAVGSPQGLDSLYGRLATHPHTPIQELRLRVSTWEETRITPHTFSDEDQADLLATCCEILRYMPELESLLVYRSRSWYAFQAAPLEALLRGAAWQCPKLRTLRLPASEVAPNDEFETVEQYGETYEAVLAALVQALAAWKPHGGLKHVVVSMPFYAMRDRHLRAAEFLTALATNCPQLERLGSPNWPRCRDFEGELVHEEHWHVDLDTWATFCASCTQLRAFDWTNAPFATAYFDVFGRVRKPQLTTLALVASNWSWHIFHRHHPRLRDGYGKTARAPERALVACPALRILTVCDDDRVPESIFGDDFVETLALHCRQLEEFGVILRIDPYGRRIAVEDVTTAITFSDGAMRALGTLPMLTRVSLRTVNITGDGLFALAVEFAQSDWRKLRKYMLRVGDHVDIHNATAFNQVVLKFLTRLAQCDRLPCADERVALRVYNGNQANRWSLAQQATLKQLVDAVLRKHRTVGLRVAVTQPLTSMSYNHPIGFHSVTDFVFYTKGAASRLGPCFAAFGDPPYIPVFVDPATVRSDWPTEHSHYRGGHDGALGEDTTNSASFA